jgi:hypothetical protein
MELDTGRRIAEMFDVICGTSAGGLLAMALLLGRSLDEVLSLLALLLQTYKCRRATGDGLAPRTLARRGTVFTTGTKVQKGTSTQGSADARSRYSVYLPYVYKRTSTDAARRRLRSSFGGSLRHTSS